MESCIKAINLYIWESLRIIPHLEMDYLFLRMASIMRVNLKIMKPTLKWVFIKGKDSNITEGSKKINIMVKESSNQLD
jgi:hypothetical protein